MVLQTAAKTNEGPGKTRRPINGCWKRLAQILGFETTLKSESCNTLGIYSGNKGVLRKTSPGAHLERMIKGRQGSGHSPTVWTDSIMKHTGLLLQLQSVYNQNSYVFIQKTKRQRKKMGELEHKILFARAMQNFNMWSSITRT